MMTVEDQLKALWSLGKERCGLIMQGGEILELPNQHADPFRNFEFEESEVTSRAAVATWHTHPVTSANLSAADYHLFLRYDTLWHYIISHDEVRAYFVQNNVVYLYEPSDDPV